MNIYEILITELNKIIGFLEVSDKSVFELIKDNDRFGIGITINNLYNNNYEEYKNHLCSSGLALGFSYFESYTYDVFQKILKLKPELNNHKITLKYVIENSVNLFDKAIEDYLRSVGFTEVIKCLEKELKFFENGEYDALMFVYNIRNCIMHNSGNADVRLNQKYNVGEKIKLSSGDVNEYGLMARKIAKSIWEKYQKWEFLIG
ncbi:hypothetical protein HY745_10390 [Candidatus Desantisbacteria bacterium]|nr:hypothetical protein [Candidatus Desantisbacteria bacterium]